MLHYKILQYISMRFASTLVVLANLIVCWCSTRFCSTLACALLVLWYYFQISWRAGGVGGGRWPQQPASASAADQRAPARRRSGGVRDRVTPNTDWLPAELDRGPEDGGVAVDASMQSSVPGIYAAGDCCCVRPEAYGPQWFQMRLWTQVTTVPHIGLVVDSRSIGRCKVCGSSCREKACISLMCWI